MLQRNKVVKRKETIFLTGMLILIFLTMANIVGVGSAVLVIMFLIILLVNFLTYGKECYKLFVNIIRQLLVIMMIVTGFFLEAAFSDLVTPKNNIQPLFICTISILIVLEMLFLGYTDVFCKILYKRKSIQLQETKGCVKNWLSNNKEIVFVLIISIFLRSFMLETLQKWDAGEYYYALGNACRKFDFTFDSFFNNFRLAGHSSLGFALIMSLGEYLNPSRISGYMLVNLILTIVAIYYIYQLMKENWGGMSKGYAAFGALLVSVNPLLLGTFSYVNVDYALAIFFIFMIAMEFKKKYILMAFWGIIMVQTKEPGLVILAGYFGLRLIANLFKYKGNMKRKFILCLNDPVNWFGLIPFISYFIYVLKIKSISSWNLPSFPHTFTNTAVNSFGIAPSYMVYKIKQLVYINFDWLLIILLFCGVIIILTFRKKLQSKIKNVEGLIGVIIAYLLFSCVYITFTTYRYNVIFPVVLTILSYIIIQKATTAFKNKKIYFLLINLPLAVLMLIQSFITIDPISNKVFTTVETGSVPMLYTMKDYGHYGDGLVHNYQYTYIDKLFDKMLQSVNYNSQMYIINAGAQGGGMQVNGNGSAYKLSWDPLIQKRVFGSTSQTVPLNVYSTFELFSYLPYQSQYDAEKVDAIPNRAVVYFMEYYGEDEDATIKALSNYYIVGKRKVIKNIQGQIVFYELTKKDDFKGYSIYEFANNKDLDTSSMQFEKEFNYEHFIQQIQESAIKREQLQNKLEQMRYQTGYKSKLLEDRNTVQKGDVVSITCRSFVNGEEIKNLAINKVMGVNNLQCVIGKGNFIEGFEKNLIGKTVGDEISFTCKLPDSYKLYPQYEGKEVEFQVKINEIQGVMVIPELADEKILLFSNEKYSLEKFYEKAKKELALEQIEKIIKKNSILLDSTIISNDELLIEISWIKDYYKILYAHSTNGSMLADWQLPMYMEHYFNMNEEEFDLYVRNMAITILKEKYIQKEICKKENIVISLDKVEQEYENKYGNNELPEVENMKKYMIRDKLEKDAIVDCLIEKIVIKDQ